MGSGTEEAGAGELMPTDIAERDDFKEMELWEHLAELRSRLIRAVIYVLVGLVVAWFLYNWIYKLFMAPMAPVLKEHPEWKITYLHITDGFMVQLQVSLVAGLVIAIPLITLEAWGFIAPGLTRTERKAFYLVVPLSLLFFFMGIACGYIVMYPSVQWFAQYIPKDGGGVLLQSPLTYIIFMVKMVLAFGICFQLPVVLMFLGYIGMVTSQGLRQQWRMAVVLAFAIGAIATPGGDPFSMMLMAAPLWVLYLASIFLVAFVERVKDRREKKLASASYAGATSD
jgi:sec-independent protein translocase protein TatC